MKRIGIWGANGINPDINRMYAMKPGAVTVINDYLSHNAVADYARQHPEMTLIVRFLHPQNWLENVVESAHTQARRVLDKWPEMADLNPYIYFGNEMNLHYECGDADPGNQWKYQTSEHYQTLYRWVELVAQEIHASHPEIRLLPPPLAFGHGEDGDPDIEGNIKLAWAGYDFLAPLLPEYFNNILTGHYYWGDGSGSRLDWLYDEDTAGWYAFRWRRVLAMFARRYGINAQMMIDEAGNFGANDENFADQVIYYAEQTLGDPRILALTYFLWFDPTNSPGNVRNSWLQMARDVDDLVARVTAFEIDEPPSEPTPPSEPVPNGDMMFRTFEESADELDPNLRVHSVDGAGKINGSVCRIMATDVAQRHWDSNNMPKAGDVYWRVIRAALIPEAQAANGININVNFVDEHGAPYTAARALFAYPTDAIAGEVWGEFNHIEAFTYPTGQGAIAQGANGFEPPMGSEVLGPYVVGAAGVYSELIAGFGMTGNRHIEYAVTFQRAIWGDTSEPPTDPTPPSEPVPAQGWLCKLLKVLCEAFCNA